MAPYFRILFSSLLFVTLLSCSRAQESGFAVVELFTSQGCSSCPSADRVLEDISREAEKGGAPIYCLSFHVDYWNRLGWTDPFSRADYSERQRRYAAIKGSPRIYTPQMIVNGEEEFVGSNRRLASGAIANALKNEGTVVIELQVEAANPGERVVKYGVAGAGTNEVLNLALVQREGKNTVPRGENAGRTLTHRDIVRDFRVLTLKKGGSGSHRFELPEGARGEDWAVVAYTQTSHDGRITGASRVLLKS